MKKIILILPIFFTLILFGQQHEYFGPYTADVKFLFNSDTMFLLYDANNVLYKGSLDGDAWEVDTILQKYYNAQGYFTGNGDTIVFTNKGRLIISTDNGRTWQQTIQAYPYYPSGDMYFLLIAYGNKKVLIGEFFPSSSPRTYSWFSLWLRDIETNLAIGAYYDDKLIARIGVRSNCARFIFGYFFASITILYDTDEYYNNLFKISDDGTTKIVLKGFRIWDICNTKDNQLIAGYRKGVLISSDTGNTWVNIGLDSLNVLSVAAMGNYIFAGTETRGLFYTTDLGKHWYPCNDGIFSNRISYIKAIRGKLVVGTSNGVYVSADTGRSWQPKNKGLRNASSINNFVYNGDEVFVGSRTQGLFYSPNNGNNWEQRVKGLNSLDIRGILVKEDTLFIGTNGGGFFYSVDRGLNWNPRNEGLASKDITYFLNMGDTFFVALASKGVWRSTNSGLSWELSTKNIPWGNTKILGAGNGMIFINVGNSIYRTTDNGESWENVSSGDMNCFIYDDGKCYFANSDGILVSEDSGKTMKQIAMLGGSIYWIKKVDSLLFTIPNKYPKTVYVSNDKGKTWKSKTNLQYVEYITEWKDNYLIGFGNTGLYKYTLEDILPYISISDVEDVSMKESEERNVEFNVSALSPESLKVSLVSSNKTLLPVENMKLSGSAGKYSLRFKPVAGRSGKAFVQIWVEDPQNHEMATDMFGVNVEKSKLTVIPNNKRVELKDNQKYIETIIVKYYDPTTLQTSIQSTNQILLPLSQISLQKYNDTTFILSAEPKRAELGEATLKLKFWDIEDTVEVVYDLIYKNGVPIIQKVPDIIMYSGTQYCIKLYYDYPNFEALNFSFTDTKNLFYSVKGYSFKVEKIDDDEFQLCLRPKLMRWGTTEVKMTVEDGNDTVTQYFTVIIIGPAGVENEVGDRFETIPNPAEDYIEIQLPEEYEIDAMHNCIQVYNIFGENVITADVGQMLVERRIRIDISKLPSGCYILRYGNYSKIFVKK